MIKYVPAVALACLIPSLASGDCPTFGTTNNGVLSVCSTMGGSGEYGFCVWNATTGSSMAGLVWQMAQPQTPDTWVTIDTGDHTINGQAAALHVTCWSQCLVVDSSTPSAVGAKLRAVRIDSTGQCPMLIGPSVTIQARPCCGLADMGSRGAVPGADGYLDNNDFIVFIDKFFNFDPIADVGTCGGTSGHDALYDNNDFVVYINYFFTDAGLCTH